MSHALDRLFTQLDLDGDGRVDRSELCRALQSLTDEELTYEDLVRTLDGADADGDGSISLAEFRSLMSADEDVGF